ncbi:MAG: AI-2E family transporter [Defluviitaleaceae bacterium]|nr:AI-2E family transporter [Defluviitaleaceae bacterium]
MRGFFSQQQWKTFVFFLVLGTMGFFVFRIIWDIDIVFGWFGMFFAAISPFVWGFAVAYVLEIPRERFEGLLDKTRIPLIQARRRGFSVLLTYIALVIVVIILARIIIPPIYASITDFIAFVPTLILRIQEFLYGLDNNESIPISGMADLMEDFGLENLLGYLSLENITGAFDAIMNVSGIVFRMALALISSVYFLIEGPRIKEFFARVLRAIMNSHTHAVFMKYGRSVNEYFKRYLRCQVLDAVILGVIMTIVTSVMRVEYALVIGPMLGFANLIPYFGSIVGTIIAIIIIFLTDGPTLGVFAAVVLFIFQQIDANFIFPRLLGGSMKVSPLLVIIAIAIGNFYYGIIGMIIATPIVTVGKNIVDDILQHIEARRAGKKPQRRASDAKQEAKEE